ncbi:hypothetical protein [Vibrio sp. Hal054]|uniref:hypothetical protein n=1 Tax=Vibrio sp. Hal054 TaxID=3035158 RepID=UPI00301E0A16
MTDVLPQMSIDALMALKDKHKIDYPNTPEAAKWLTPWVIEDVKRITPITYDRKSGPVVWVCL